MRFRRLTSVVASTNENVKLAFVHKPRSIGLQQKLSTL